MPLSQQDEFGGIPTAELKKYPIGLNAALAAR